VNSDAIISKHIVDATDNEPSGSVGGGQDYNFDARGRSPFMPIGLFEEYGKLKHPEINFSDLQCSGRSEGGTFAYCAGVSRIAVDLRFKESDPNYMVDKVSQKERIYYITLLDNTYVPFTANYRQGAIENYLYTQTPSPQNCSFSNGWTCAVFLKEGKPDGCRRP
jgi:hypothetical protein